MVCNVCQKDIVKVFKGKITKHKKRVYHSADGGEWMGRTCPKCRYLPKNSSNIVSIGGVLKRRCKKVVNKTTLQRCNKLLPPTRYFQCEECMPELGDDVDGVYIYEAA